VVRDGGFRGIYALSLDNKGRMALPIGCREIFQVKEKHQLIVTIDPIDPCLWLCPLNNWHAIESKIAALPSFQSDARRIQRLLIGHAVDLELDNQGRILIPIVLREYAQLEKNVIMMGQGKRFEIWSAQTLETRRKEWLVETAQQAELSNEIRELVL
jgi:MraZ protein